MEKVVGIGYQDFEKIRMKNNFYVDKTHFIREWWKAGFGRYDVMLEPREISGEDAIILEFKVQDDKEKELSDTVREALRQIEERDYQASL